MVLINRLLQCPQYYILPRADATSVASGSRQRRRECGSTQTPLNPPSDLVSSSHPCLPSRYPLSLLSSSFLSSPVQVVDCRIIFSLLACLYHVLEHPAPILATDHFSQDAGGGKVGRESREAEGLMHSMYLTSAPVTVALKQTGRNNLHATSTKPTNKQIAECNKLQKPFGDIICMTKHVSSTEWGPKMRFKATHCIIPSYLRALRTYSLLWRQKLKG